MAFSLNPASSRYVFRGSPLPKYVQYLLLFPASRGGEVAFCLIVCMERAVRMETWQNRRKFGHKALNLEEDQNNFLTVRILLLAHLASLPFWVACKAFAYYVTPNLCFHSWTGRYSIYLRLRIFTLFTSLGLFKTPWHISG